MANTSTSLLRLINMRNQPQCRLWHQLQIFHDMSSRTHMATNDGEMTNDAQIQEKKTTLEGSTSKTTIPTMKITPFTNPPPLEPPPNSASNGTVITH